MKKTLLLITLIFGTVSIATGQKKDNNETYFVINVLGADLFERPSLDSKVIEKIKVGEEIISTEILKTEQSKIIGVDFYLSGSFIKTQVGSKNGYVFTSDLTKTKPSLEITNKVITIPNINGPEKNKRTEKRTGKFDDGGFELEDEITEFENTTLTYTAYDGCFNYSYLYRNFTLSEVYHQLIVNQVVINETEMKIEIPRFIEKKGNQYHFEGEGATEDLKIIDNNDGTFTVSSYDCT